MSCQLALEFNLGHCQFNLGMRKSGSALSENQRNHQGTFHKYRSAASIVCGCNAHFSSFRFGVEGVVTQSQSAVSCLSYVTQLSDSCRFILIAQDSPLLLLNNPTCTHPNFPGHTWAILADVYGKMGHDLKTGNYLLKATLLHLVQKIAKYSTKPCLWPAMSVFKK